MTTGVHRFLATATHGPRLALWQCTAVCANWLDARDNPRGGETWLVTVFTEHAQQFLDAATALGVTVEEIESSGDEEKYRLRVGEPGTGWQAAEGESR